MITLDEIDRLRAEGLGLTRIARRLRTTRGTVAGMIYRRAHPPAPRPRKLRPPAVHTEMVAAYLDDETVHQIDVLAAKQRTSRSAVIRDLIEWGLEATRGELK